MRVSEVSINPPVLPNIYFYKGWWRVRLSGNVDMDIKADLFVCRINFYSEK